jgi:hypothetical protein
METGGLFIVITSETGFIFVQKNISEWCVVLSGLFAGKPRSYRGMGVNP